MLHRLSRLQPPTRRAFAYLLAFASGLVLAGAAQAQVTQQKLCRDPNPAIGRCDAGTCADIGGACTVSSDCADPDGVGPSGFNPVPEGGQLDCEFKVEWNNQIQDVLRLELDGTSHDPLAPSGVFNQVPPGGPFTDLKDSIEPPLLFPPRIGAVDGNAACAGACDPATGAGCTLPCIVCPPNVTTTDPVIDATRGSGLACPGNEESGAVFFLDEESVEQCVEDDFSVTGLSITDQATVVWRNVCNGFGPPCNPITFNSDDSPQTVPCQRVEQSNNFKCYAAKPAYGTSFTPTPVIIEDQFGTTQATIHSPFQICTPVTKLEREPAEEFGPEDPHLMCYKLTNQVSPNWLAFHRDTDQFGSEVLRSATRPRVLCLPALKNCDPTLNECSLATTEASLAHFACYNSIVDEETFPDLPGGIEFVPPGTLALADQFQTTTSAVGDVDLHCNPVVRKQVSDNPSEPLSVPVFTPEFPVPAGLTPPFEQHLKCYGLTDTERNFGVPTVSVVDQLQLDPRQITVGAGIELCEPAVKELILVAPTSRNCGLLGIEALIPILPLAWSRRLRRAVTRA
jgi:hypothetical protein